MTDFGAVCRRAGGRRRYDAMRRRKAEARRKSMAEVLARGGVFHLGQHGLSSAVASAYGVHRATIRRDLSRVLGGGVCHNFTGADDEVLFTITCAYRGGPVLSVTDADDNEVHGAARKSILRRFRSVVRR